MQKKHIIMAIVGIIALVLFSLSTQAVSYGDKTCNLGELFPGMPVWFCFNPDGGMDHSFFSYEAMDTYYDPPLVVISGSPTELIVVYGVPTETLSGV